jgi:hypothetical protein
MVDTRPTGQGKVKPVNPGIAAKKNAELGRKPNSKLHIFDGKEAGWR